jgi:MgtE intracellular N domain
MVSKDVKLKLVAELSLLIVVTTMFPSKVLALQTNTNQTLIIKNTTNTLGNRTNISGDAEIRKPNAIGSKIEPSDLPHASKKDLTNTQIVQKELSTMSPDEIKTYPLKDVPSDELVIVLNGLSVQNLEKVLENIPAADLGQIFNKVPQDKREEILNKLPQDKRQETLDRLTGELFK